MLVTIEVFATVIEAQIVQAQLTSAGITSFIPDMHTLGANGMSSHMLGGARLQVAAESVTAARQIIETDAHSYNNMQSVDAHDDADQCPACHSTHMTEYRQWALPAILTLWLFNLPFFPRNRRMQCLDCGHVFQWR